MDSNKFLGTIFDDLNYDDPDTIDKLIDELESHQLNYLIILALKSAFNRNSYSLLESEIVSKIIRKLNKFENEPKP